LFDGKSKMFLHIGWKKFAHTHNLEVGFLLNFKWEGDDELRVKVFTTRPAVGTTTATTTIAATAVAMSRSL
jgi:hypothetical protein